MNVGSISAPIVFGSVGANASPIHNEAMRYLMARVVVRNMGHASPCWIWQGSFKEGGYGQIGSGIVADGVCKGAHRASKIVLQGWEPASRAEQVRHQCHVRACINPWHSLTGSALDNRDDWRRDEGPGQKLTPDDVREIRARWARDEYPQAIGDRYGVHQSTVYRIVRHDIWAHVE